MSLRTFEHLANESVKLAQLRDVNGYFLTRAHSFVEDILEVFKCQLIGSSLKPRSQEARSFVLLENVEKSANALLDHVTWVTAHGHLGNLCSWRRLGVTRVRLRGLRRRFGCGAWTLRLGCVRLCTPLRQCLPRFLTVGTGHFCSIRSTTRWLLPLGDVLLYDIGFRIPFAFFFGQAHFLWHSASLSLLSLCFKLIILAGITSLRTQVCCLGRVDF